MQQQQLQKKNTHNRDETVKALCLCGLLAMEEQTMTIVHATATFPIVSVLH